VSGGTSGPRPLRIVVCIKQVPKAQELQVDPVTQTLKRVGVPSEINPPDANALEIALTLKDRHAAEVVVLSMGPTSFDESLESAMQVLASTLRLPPDRDVQKQRADAATKATVAKARVRPAQARKEIPPLDDDGRTAIYDITARVVYLPSGRRLEAHSGLGGFMDSPRHVHLRMRGATPPNIYNLTLREQLFHGVRAIRLNPVDDSRMHGRDGILAHSFMLGPNGQSNGCVSFSNYPEFLNAFLKGEVTRLAVVERLESPPGKLAAGQLPEPVRDLLKATDRSRQYAAAR